MKPIRGVLMNADTLQSMETDIYVTVDHVKDGTRPVSVVTIGSNESNVQYTVRAYDLREAIRDR